MKIVQEFREFIARGNVVDLAVGVIIGAAFGKIVNSLVADIIMPPIGYLMHGADFSSYFISLDGTAYASRDLAKAADAPVVYYGAFLNVVIEFLIVAVCVFVLVKLVNKLKRKEAAKAAATPAPAALTPTELLLAEIRDLLKKNAAEKPAQN